MVTAPAQTQRLGAHDVLRFLLELFAFVSLGIWGFLAFAFPLNIVFGLATPAVAMLLWALFLSPKAVFAVDVFGRSLVELLVIAATTLAWLDLGQPVIGIVYAIVAVTSGVIRGRRELAR